MQNGTFVFFTHNSDPYVYGVILDLCFLTTSLLLFQFKQRAESLNWILIRTRKDSTLINTFLSVCSCFTLYDKRPCYHCSALNEKFSSFYLNDS